MRQRHSSFTARGLLSDRCKFVIALGVVSPDVSLTSRLSLLRRRLEVTLLPPSESPSVWSTLDGSSPSLACVDWFSVTVTGSSKAICLRSSPTGVWLFHWLHWLCWRSGGGLLGLRLRNCLRIGAFHAHQASSRVAHDSNVNAVRVLHFWVRVEGWVVALTIGHGCSHGANLARSLGEKLGCHATQRFWAGKMKQSAGHLWWTVSEKGKNDEAK